MTAENAVRNALLATQLPRLSQCQHQLGVRPMALAGHCAAVPMVMLRASTRLATAAMRFDALPFVIDFGDGRADCGYAAAKWVIDLYESVVREKHPHRHQVIGLLLGYSASAIARHEENGTSRRFAEPATEGMRDD